MPSFALIELRQRIAPLVLVIDIAEAARFSGDLDRAGKHYREALNIAERIRSKHDVAVYTGNVAALALDREDSGF